jgi:hypothetical protein
MNHQYLLAAAAPLEAQEEQHLVADWVPELNLKNSVETTLNLVTCDKYSPHVSLTQISSIMRFKASS